MDTEYGKFLRRLTEYRTGLKLTQQQVAGALGITQTKYSKFERGALRIHQDTLSGMSGMGWDVSFILDGVQSDGDGEDVQAICYEYVNRCTNGRFAYARRCAERDASAEEKTRCAAYAAEIDDALLHMLAFLFDEFSEEASFDETTRKEIRLLKMRLHYPAETTEIEVCRAMLGKTQEQMATAMHLGTKTYRAIERGEKGITADQMVVLGALTGSRASLFLFPKNMGWSIVRHVWSRLSCGKQEELKVLLAAFAGVLGSARKEI